MWIADGWKDYEVIEMCIRDRNYVDEEIFATDDTVDKVKAVNSLDEEGEYDVTPITQEIIDGRAY